mmetsp:Transcript_8569/g.25665  ORF Transcript_8569/g.25665 Transcript_8569/m.25665 type:complete len:211 (+) Transcript_8569:1627-2259(+)
MMNYTAKGLKTVGQLLFMRRQGTAALCSGLQQAGQAVKSNVTSAAEATVVPVPAFDSWFLRTSSAQMSPAIFDITTAVFGQKKSQGEQPTGDKPAENPRADVPPISPEDREKHPEVPPSPDATSGKSNDADYNSPGTHPSSNKNDSYKPDMDNASEAVTKKASRAREHSQRMDAEPTGGDGTGPATHDDDPPGVDKASAISATSDALIAW